jgi:hypothetical protein
MQIDRSPRIRAFGEAAWIFERTGPDPTPELLLQTAAGRLSDVLGDGCFASLLGQDGRTLRAVGIGHVDQSACALLREMLTHQPEVLPNAFSQRVVQTGGSLCMPRLTVDLMRLWTQPAYWTYLDAYGIRGVLAAALLSCGRIVGTLNVWRERRSPMYHDADEVFLAGLARRIALGLDTR